MNRNISQKERTINYIRFQISQLSEMIEDNKKNKRSPEASSHLYSERNNLYKELRHLSKQRRSNYKKAQK